MDHISQEPMIFVHIFSSLQRGRRAIHGWRMTVGDDRWARKLPRLGFMHPNEEWIKEIFLATWIEETSLYTWDVGHSVSLGPPTLVPWHFFHVPVHLERKVV